MVIKKIFILLFLNLLIFKNNLYASQILDFETELFVSSIISEIKKVNKIKREIKFKIFSDKSINAFVTENDTIFITSGLIENCNDYVALLSVIAHEIGHIDLNHISLRKISTNKINNFKKLSNLSVIAGSMMSSNPNILHGIAISSASSSNLFLNFSKEQETEADIYSLKTLENLKLYSDSIIQLLNSIEKKALEKGLTKEKQKLSTHPYFEERVDLINHLTKKSGTRMNHDINEKFMFIKAKYTGYSKNIELINELEGPYKMYSDSIMDANNGNLYSSLKKLNSLILDDDDNFFLYETKADILFSFGFIKESVEFYKKILKKYPNNYYAQIRIFSNLNIETLSNDDVEIFFINNLNLLKKYYNNRNILTIYKRLADKNEKTEWINFLDFWLNNQIYDNALIIEKLDKFNDTNDKNLKEIIKIIKNKNI